VKPKDEARIAEAIAENTGFADTHLCHHGSYRSPEICGKLGISKALLRVISRLGPRKCWRFVRSGAVASMRVMQK